MAAIGVATQQFSAITDATKPVAWRDQALKNVPNAGVRFRADTAFPWSYPGGAPSSRPAAGPPVNGQTIYDMAGLANGAMATTGTQLTYAGNMFDASALTSGNQAIAAPASVAADIATAFGGVKQQFLIIMWVKIPLLADWNTNGADISIIGDKSYFANPSLLTIGMRTGGLLVASRQTASGTATSYTLAPAAADYGKVVQIAFWRNASGIGLRLRSVNGTVLTTAALGSDNTQDFSTNQLLFGRGGPFYGAASTSQGLNGYRFGILHIENLARSGRDPTTVLDADYAAVVKRNILS